jgi:phosphate-selective porin OprO/OprP
VAALLVGALGVGPAWAGGQNVEDRLRQLEYRLEEQERKLQEQMDQIKAQKEQIQAQREELEKVDTTKAAAPNDFKVFWKDAPRFETNDGDFTLKLGGRIQTDAVAIDADDDVEDEVGNVENGVEFRRARISLEGELYERYEFKMQYDFAGGESTFKDVYVGMTKIPWVGGVRVGQFKEPFSLEELTSSNYGTFLERGLPNAFAPARNTGIQLANHVLGDRMTWAAGAFRDTDDFGDRIGDGEWNFTGRVTGLPWYDDEAHLLHLGTAYSFRNPNDGEVGFSQRPEIHTTPRYVNTSAIPADDYQLLGLEGAFVFGPASVQAEWIRSDVNADASANPDFHGWYAYASWFITGDHRVYKPAEGAFDKVKPAHPFLWGENAGAGAWEVAARYSQIDLDDSNIDGGQLDDVTLGVNWYLNTNFRIMANYIFADLDDVGDTHAFTMRFQFFM